MSGPERHASPPGFYPSGPAKTMALPTHGLKQALALRGWIVAQYKDGKLNAVD